MAGERVDSYGLVKSLGASLPPALALQEQKGAQGESQRGARSSEPRQKGKAAGLTCRSWAEATVQGYL